MDNRPPSIQKPLHGYKKLIRGQVCRLRNKSQQPTGSSSPESKEKPESSDESASLEETVIKVSCRQWQGEGSVPTRPSIDVRWKGTTCQNEATRDTAARDGERDYRSRDTVNCRAQLTETSSVAENSIEEKQERYIRNSLLLDGADQGTRQNIAEKTSQSTGAIRTSRCEPYSNVSNVKSSRQRDGQDGGSCPIATTSGGPLELRTPQGPGLQNDGSNISVVIDDPLTVDLLLAEQGQLFHTGEAIRTSNELLLKANSIDRSRKDVSIVSRTQQVQVAVRNRTITEASITTFSEKVTENRFLYSSVSTETRLVPRSTSTLMEEGRNFRHILDKGKISREKHVRFADEAEHLKLCSTSASQETALPSGGERPHAYRTDVTPQCVGTLSKDGKTKGREQSNQKNNCIHHREESRVESVHTSNAQESAIIPGNSQYVSTVAMRDVDPKPHPDLGNRAFRMDGIEVKAQQENKMPRLPTPGPRPSANALGSLSISNRATTFVRPEVKTKQSSLRKSTVPRMSQSAENARIPPRTDGVSPGKRKNESEITETSSNEKNVTPFKTRDATSSSVRVVAPPVATRVLQSRSEPGTSRRSRREQSPVRPVATPVHTARKKCCNCLVALLRAGLIVLVIVLVVQALAFCLAVGFVTECDSNSVLFSPVWGFSWIQFDVTPLASIVRQNLRLINYKTPPT